MEQVIKKYYDADYIIRKNNEYEEILIYNHPVEKKLRDMIKTVNELCAIENEKCKIRKAKLEEKRLLRLKKQNLTEDKTMEKWEWVVDIFTFIGIVVSVIIALIAIVWITCFAVKLLIKIFGVKVGSSFEIMKEDIAKKAEAKKERKEKKRNAIAEHKMELLNLKLESKQRVHEMKKQKLAANLSKEEENAKQKILGDNVEISRDELVEEVEKFLKDAKSETIVENEVAEKQKAKKTRKKSNKKENG